MNTLYVPLEEVILLLHTNFPLAEQEITLRNALKDIEYLPTIDLSIIDEMIEENRYEAYIEWHETDRVMHQYEILQELKSRLSPKN